MVFTDRSEAGRLLAERLQHLRGRDAMVFSLVRGGVPVGHEVAKALGAPLDIVLVRKIGVPDNPELAAGAVVDGDEPEFVLNNEIVEALGLAQADIDRAAERELREIERRRTLYLGGRQRESVEGKSVIVVDDGIATGATTRAALHALRRQNPAHLVLAVPVAPPDALQTLRSDADEVVCLHVAEHLGAIGFYYRDFSQVSDQQVTELLDRADGPRADEAADEGKAPC